MPYSIQRRTKTQRRIAVGRNIKKRNEDVNVKSSNNMESRIKGEGPEPTRKLSDLGVNSICSTMC